MFHYGCYKSMTSNNFTIMTVDSSPMVEESQVTTISAIPDDTVDLEKRYYHGVYILINFNKGGIFCGKKYQSDVEAVTYV